MKALQKLVRNGNATSVTVPRTILVHLGWLPGQSVVIETTTDAAVIVRRPRESDFGVNVTPQIFEPSPAGARP